VVFAIVGFRWIAPLVGHIVRRGVGGIGRHAGRRVKRGDRVGPLQVNSMRL
jgi:hypothetical protein